ncbi:MAG TPA: hypothetical protein VKZ45_01870 [Vicingaceae bacterium]|nr:hypothetical protein [Vicingaceae bacterium]
MKKNYVFSSVVMLSLAFLTTPTLTAQNIGINASGAAPDAGAMLDISSTNKGLLIPRVNITNLNNIAPITGSATVSMLVYNTNATTGQGYYYWNGAQWVRLSSGDAWQITGNNNTTFGTHFLGTTNAQGVDFRTNNIIRLRIPNANQIHANANGTAALPFYSWANDANTGMSSFAGDQLNWSTGGAERLRLTNTQLATTFSGTAGVPAYSFTTDTDIGMYRATTNALGFSTAGVERIRIGDYTGSIGIGRVPCCGSLGGPIVDVYEPMEIGNDAGTNRQARIGYWYGGDVAIDPEVDGWGYVGYISRAWWGMYSYGFFNASERKKKKEITPINQNEDIEKIVMQDIEKINPSFYYYKQQNNSPSSSFDTRYRPHFQLGVIVDESPDYLLDESFTGVDVYAVASLSLAGVKYNHKKIQEIENKLTHSLTINDFGSVQENNNKVFVKYSEEFISQLNGANPIINITPISEKEINLRIVQKTNDGFIVAANSDEKIISFDWIAIAKVNTVKEDENSDSTTVDDSLLKKIHLTPEEKQKAIEHYSNIKNSLTPQTE